MDPSIDPDAVFHGNIVSVDMNDVPVLDERGPGFCRGQRDTEWHFSS